MLSVTQRLFSKFRRAIGSFKNCFFFNFLHNIISLFSLVQVTNTLPVFCCCVNLPVGKFHCPFEVQGLQKLSFLVRYSMNVSEKSSREILTNRNGQEPWLGIFAGSS